MAPNRDRAHALPGARAGRLRRRRRGAAPAAAPEAAARAGGGRPGRRGRLGRGRPHRRPARTDSASVTGSLGQAARPSPTPAGPATRSTRCSTWQAPARSSPTCSWSASTRTCAYTATASRVLREKDQRPSGTSCGSATSSGACGWRRSVRRMWCSSIRGLRLRAPGNSFAAQAGGRDAMTRVHRLCSLPLALIGAGCAARADGPDRGEVTGVSVVAGARRPRSSSPCRGAVQVRDFMLKDPDRLVLDVVGAKLDSRALGLYDGVKRGGVLNLRYSPVPRPTWCGSCSSSTRSRTTPIDQSAGRDPGRLRRRAAASWPGRQTPRPAASSPAPAGAAAASGAAPAGQPEVARPWPAPPC